MNDDRSLPRWFRAAFIIALLLLTAELFWFAPQQVELQFRIADVAQSLDTSRQREAKQTYEYDQVVAKLPQALAELEAVQPLADAAKARETELRAQRKALRAEAKEQAAQLEAAGASAAELTQQAEALQAEVEALRAQQQALQAQVDALLAELGRTP